MSYAVNIFFKRASSSTVFDIIKEFKEWYWERRTSLIEDNLYYIPSIRYGCKPEDEKLNDARDEAWLHSLMTIKFIYWKKFNLLGVVASEAPKGWFGVCFQNSCDQDYELSSWPKLKFFKDIIQSVNKMSDEEIFKQIDEDYDEDLDVEYWRLTTVYEKIFSELCLNQWLYSRDADNVSYICLNESCLDDIVKTYNLMSKVKMLRKKY